MRVLHLSDSFAPIENAVVTVGSFDGVHIGHQALIGRLNAIAREKGGSSVVVTFDPHPRAYFGRRDDFFELTPLTQKIDLMAQSGVDYLLIAPFADIAAMPSREFVERILIDRIGARHIVVGYNNNFGSDHRGDYQSLAAIASELNISVELFPKLMLDGHKVSSTTIRHAIEQGDKSLASKLLGRNL